MPQGNYVKPVKVRAGLSDGVMTEVSGDELQEGLAVVTGEQQQDVADDAGTKNPFAPQFIRGRGRTP